MTSIEFSHAKTKQDFLTILHRSGVLSSTAFARAESLLTGKIQTAADAARVLIVAAVLTPFQAERLLAGKTDGLVLGQYVVLAPIRSGPLGAWYKARHRTMHRHAAIHILSPQVTRDETRCRLLHEAARQAARLTHPNIINILDFNQIEQRMYLVTEYVDGQTLQKFMEENRQLDIRLSAEILAQIARGLAHAHEHKITHGCLNPASILIAKQLKKLEPKISEFGLFSKHQLYHQVDPTLLADYLPPERDEERTATPASDMYGLGCLAYRIVTGFAPYEGADPVLKAEAHRSDPVPAPERVHPGMDASLAKLIKSLMAKHPKDRPQSAEKVASEFEGFSRNSEQGTIDFNSIITKSSSTTIPKLSSSLLTGLNSAVEPTEATRGSEPSPWLSLRTASSLLQLKTRNVSPTAARDSPMLTLLALALAVMLATATCILLVVRFLAR